MSVGVLAASGGLARAAVVSQWDFTLDAAFDLSQTVDSNSANCSGACGVSATAGTTNTFWSNPASIYWGGTPPDVSGVTIGKTDVTGQFQDPGPHTSNGGNGPGSYVGNFTAGPGVDGTGVTTNGGFIPTVNFTHHNADIPASAATLQSSVLLDRLLLTPHSGGPSLPLVLAFDVLFKETFNGATPLNNPANDDIFVIDPQGGLMFNGDTLSQGFTYMGQDYLGQLKLAGLMTLTDDQCDAAGAAHGCKGLVTTEGQNNTFNAQLAITAVPIPPAGVLFLTALAGLGVISRRKGVISRRRGAQPA